jgi:hypothetical protein
MSKPDKSALRDLQQIPGVGRGIAEDLWNMDFRAVQDLQNQDCEELYLKLCAQKGVHVDRCALYVFRCAVYFASSEKHDSELLKWWNWKDDNDK